MLTMEDAVMNNAQVICLIASFITMFFAGIASVTKFESDDREVLAFLFLVVYGGLIWGAFS